MPLCPALEAPLGAVPSSGSSAQQGQELLELSQGLEHLRAQERLRELGLLRLERSPSERGWALGVLGSVCLSVCPCLCVCPCLSVPVPRQAQSSPRLCSRPSNGPRATGRD